MIAELDTVQIEHLAVRAAELKDGYVEHACNMALAIPGAKLGELTYEQVLRGVIADEPRYWNWMEFGRHTGYRKRTT